MPPVIMGVVGAGLAQWVEWAPISLQLSYPNEQKATKIIYVCRKGAIGWTDLGHPLTWGLTHPLGHLAPVDPCLNVHLIITDVVEYVGSDACIIYRFIFKRSIMSLYCV